MPRQPKHPRQEISHQSVQYADNGGTAKGEVKCRNCGYTWYPDPTKWRNGSSPNGVKMLYCPYCAVKNRIENSKLLEIVRRAEVIAELRHIGRRQ